MVSKHQTLLHSFHSYRSEDRSTSVWRQLRINMLWKWKVHEITTHVRSSISLAFKKLTLYQQKL